MEQTAKNLEINFEDQEDNGKEASVEIDETKNNVSLKMKDKEGKSVICNINLKEFLSLKPVMELYE